MEKSIEIMKISDGAFDITVAPLVDFWGFGDKSIEKKDTSEIKNILENIGISNIRLDGNHLIKKSPNVKINVNAIAQGYTVDIISNFLEKNGITNYMVEIGGEIRTSGLNKDGIEWKIGIDKPVDNNYPGTDLHTIIKLSGKSVSTSGNYRNFYIENGIKYAHTINPKTGYPARNELLSATILTDDCATADALATACMVMGLNKSLSFLKRLDGIEGYFISLDMQNNFKINQTRGFEKFLDVSP